MKDITGHEKQVGREIRHATQHLAKCPGDICLSDIDPVLVGTVMRTVSQVEVGSVN
jgi:hypothetical protein